MSSGKPSNEASRLIAAYKNSLAGLKQAWGEAAFRTEIFLLFVFVPLAFYLEHDGLKLAVMLASLWLVLIVELLNTGIEKTVDRISGEWHALSKYAKDAGSAAVLFSILNMATVWLLVLFW